jgi:putative endonuclease
MNKKIIGAWGEKIAKTYLENKGYTILETNWHYHHKELDIIAYQNGLVGFEIKTRTSQNNLSFTILKATQVTRLRLALKAYCRLHQLNYNKTRLDLLVITVKSRDSVLVKHCLDI